MKLHPRDRGLEEAMRELWTLGHNDDPSVIRLSRLYNNWYCMVGNADDINDPKFKRGAAIRWGVEGAIDRFKKENRSMNPIKEKQKELHNMTEEELLVREALLEKEIAAAKAEFIARTGMSYEEYVERTEGTRECNKVREWLVVTPNGKTAVYWDSKSSLQEYTAHLKECASCRAIMDGVNEYQGRGMTAQEAYGTLTDAEMDEHMNTDPEGYSINTGSIQGEVNEMEETRRNSAQVTGMVLGKSARVTKTAAKVTWRGLKKASRWTKQTGYPKTRDGLKDIKDEFRKEWKK